MLNLTSILLTVTGALAWATADGPLTSGMVGLPVTIVCDGAWEGLTKNLVCRCSPWDSDEGETRVILDVGDTAVVAHEVMQAGMRLWLGLEGFREDGTLVIPTTWATCEELIQSGANSDGDPSADPELPIWNQLQAQIEQINRDGITQEQMDEIRGCAEAAEQAAASAARSETAAAAAASVSANNVNAVESFVHQAQTSEGNAKNSALSAANLANGALQAQRAAEAAAQRAEAAMQNLGWNAQSHGVMGDGATDDSPALNALVTAVHDAGGGTIYLPKGVYMLDSPILWQSNVSLRGEGMGLAILKTRQAAGVGEGFAAIRGLTFSLDDPCTNCTFEQFTIDGEEMQITEYTSWPKGINIHSMDQCTFRDIVIQNTCATGLGVDNLRSSVVDHVVCINCGRSWSGDGTEQNVGGAGIGIGTNSMDGESLIIQNCVADGCGNYGIFLENQGHSTPTKPESHVIANNIVRNGRNHGIIVKGDANVVVADNVVFGNAGDGLAVLENNGYVTEHILFSHNLVRGNGNGFRLESDGVCRDITLSGNVFNGNDNGIVLNTNTTELSLIGNTIKGSAAGLTVRGVHTDAIVRNNALYKNTVGEVFSGSFAGDTSQNDYVLSPGPEAIAFERSNYSIPVGGALPLSVEYTPSNVSGLVTYFVDRPEIARVEGSTLVALSEGSVVVTASCGTLTASATVAVSIPADLSAYTRLNYIQSSGTQYINTGFIPGSSTRVLAKTAHDTLDPARTICGARTASMDKEFDLRCYNQLYYGSSLVSTGINHAGTVDLNKNVLRVNGTLAGVAQPEEFTCEYPLYLFALNGAGTALSNTMAAMKLYYLHIYDGGAVVRALIPVRRKSDGAVGLVDGLTGTFYQNLGSGAFTGA